MLRGLHKKFCEMCFCVYYLMWRYDQYGNNDDDDDGDDIFKYVSH
jgi:hypothetical protein